MKNAPAVVEKHLCISPISGRVKEIDVPVAVRIEAMERPFSAKRVVAPVVPNYAPRAFVYELTVSLIHQHLEGSSYVIGICPGLSDDDVFQPISVQVADGREVMFGILQTK